MKITLTVITTFLILSLNSCSSKKQIYYLQDTDNYETNILNYPSLTIQPNDILKIDVGAIVPDLAIPYNKLTPGNVTTANSLDILKLDGYLVTKDFTIHFPVLGRINVEGKSAKELEDYIASELNKLGHLKEADVSVRLLNAKVTVLGEVNVPGTINYTEEQITILQALGLSGDLTINGRRDEVIVMRETNGEREIGSLDLTSTTLLDSPFYYIKPNDVIVVKPNYKKVKSAGFVGDTGTILGVASLILSITILITK